MTAKASNRSGKTPHPIQVFLGKQDPVQQPEGFRVCPLGVQFYSQRALEEYELMEFKLDLPLNGRAPETISCSGMVVHCQPVESNGLYRVWIKFLDLPPEQQSRIQCMAKDGKHLCPHCENF